MKKYGIEVEYFVKNKEQEIQIVSKLELGLATDEFPILGEIRSYTRDAVYMA